MWARLASGTCRADQGYVINSSDTAGAEGLRGHSTMGAPHRVHVPTATLYITIRPPKMTLYKHEGAGDKPFISSETTLNCYIQGPVLALCRRLEYNLNAQLGELLNKLYVFSLNRMWFLENF